MVATPAKTAGVDQLFWGPLNGCDDRLQGLPFTLAQGKARIGCSWKAHKGIDPTTCEEVGDRHGAARAFHIDHHASESRSRSSENRAETFDSPAVAESFGPCLEVGRWKKAGLAWEDRTPDACVDTV
jgi:hypothetical protein